MRTASLLRSPTSLWLSKAGLDVGADAAVPEQIDVRLENGLDHFVRRDLRGKLEQRLRFARQGQALGGSRVHAAALRNRARANNPPSEERGILNSRSRSAKRARGDRAADR